MTPALACAVCCTPVPQGAPSCPRCGTVTPPEPGVPTASDEAVAVALGGRYGVERRIGQGGMALVYLARDLARNRLVALKVLRSELAESMIASRFLREIEIGATLSHPHILPLLDSGRAGGLVYFATPYVDGETLRERLQREQRLDIGDALRITADVAEALNYAHGRGVIHRDVKPENILLDGRQALLADFGIARALTAAGRRRLTDPGLAVGTPCYMSPEQGSAHADVDGRSDVYSLGCVLYEMLTGSPPFTGRTVREVMASHAVDEPPSLRAIRPETPSAVERAVMRALAKAPNDRFHTAAEFAAALASALAAACS